MTRDTHPAPLVVGEHLHVPLAGTLPLPQPHQLAAGRSCHQVNIAGQDNVCRGYSSYSRGQVYWHHPVWVPSVDQYKLKKLSLYWHHPTCPVEVLRRLEVWLVRGRLLLGLVLVWEGVAVVASPGLAAAGLRPHRGPEQRGRGAGHGGGLCGVTRFGRGDGDLFPVC